jgi:butyryl-CoA dehydrogenase
LSYARERRQGRPPGPAGKNPATPPVPIIEHADVKRMLLAQKSYVEGGLALELYCGRLVDEARVCSEAGDDVAGLHGLLELLTPIAKSWPSEWCLAANDLAIQVHGGYGYTRDFPVEQLWRDNRLNMIHEGTHGIHGIDLLGRKVRMDDGRALHELIRRMEWTAETAGRVESLVAHASELRHAASLLRDATVEAWADADPAICLANATLYLQAFGHIVVAWLWLDIAMAAERAVSESDTPQESAFHRGKLHAARYFFTYELPKTHAWLQPVCRREAMCLQMNEAWFET